MWKLKQILMENTAAKSGSREKRKNVIVILANEEGEEKTFEANEDWIAAIEKLSANPLMKIIISKPMAKDCQYKRSWWRRKAMAIRRKVYRETGVSR